MVSMSKEYRKEYYEKNKQKYLNAAKIKVECDVCECQVIRCKLSRHKKSKKCQGKGLNQKK